MIIVFQTSISKAGDAAAIGLAVVNTIIGGSSGDNDSQICCETEFIDYGRIVEIVVYLIVMACEVFIIINSILVIS
jgi:hypothetical protein